MGTQRLNGCVGESFSKVASRELFAAKMGTQRLNGCVGDCTYIISYGRGPGFPAGCYRC